MKLKFSAMSFLLHSHGMLLPQNFVISDKCKMCIYFLINPCDICLIFSLVPWNTMKFPNGRLFNRILVLTYGKWNTHKHAPWSITVSLFLSPFSASTSLPYRFLLLSSLFSLISVSVFHLSPSCLLSAGLCPVSNYRTLVCRDLWFSYSPVRPFTFMLPQCSFS